jgi:hypothetical protein
MYKAQESDGSWRQAQGANYERSNRPFKGSPEA